MACRGTACDWGARGGVEVAMGSLMGEGMYDMPRRGGQRSADQEPC